MTEMPANDGPQKESIRQQLTNVIDPCSRANGGDLNVIEMGLLESIDINGGDIIINIRITSPTCMMIPAFVQQIEEHVGKIPSVESISVETDDGLQWEPSMMDPTSKAVSKHKTQVELIMDDK